MSKQGVSSIVISPSNLLSTFTSTAAEADLEFFVIGGFAVSYWAAPRFTADVDVVIENTSYELALEVSEAIGYREEFRHPDGAFAHFSPEDGGGFRLDFMLVEPETWLKLRAEGQLVSVGEELRFPVVSCRHLIAMKLHAAKQIDRKSHFKDLNDIAELMVAQSLSFSDLKIDGILDKHGTEITIKKIQELIDEKQG